MMIPKIIHLCWFSNDPYPVEIKVCLDSWKRLLPDFEVRLWDYDAAKAIGIPFIDEALENRKWAFAADVVRFYAVWKYGGVYMDSDIFLFRRFDELLDENDFITTAEAGEGMTWWGLQAAFFMGVAGNKFCEEMVEYYRNRKFVKEDGSFDQTISPHLMVPTAEKMGYKFDDTKVQHLEGLTVLPTRYLSPQKKWEHDKEAIGVHRVYGSWKKKKLGRKIDIWVHHVWHVIRYALFKR